MRAKSTGTSTLATFEKAVRHQLLQKTLKIRVFDIGGSGVKTGLTSTQLLKDFLLKDGKGEEDSEPEELRWLEVPRTLGSAPGEEGFHSWLLQLVPTLRKELAENAVAFGVSTAGDLEHSTGVLKDWWTGGGHPREWGNTRENPHVAELMGLPRHRTFIIHDGAAHLLGCSRCIVPPPGTACFAVGSGVGFGLSDDIGAVVDPSSQSGARSRLLHGAPISGAHYTGLWQSWRGRPETQAAVDEVLDLEFAGTRKPWKTPWVSLVLGRRGMELAEAAFGCPQPSESAIEPRRDAAIRAYGEQWLHFLHTQFLPQFVSPTRQHRVQCLYFSGGLIETNWPMLECILTDPATRTLRPCAEPAGNPPSKRAVKSKNIAAPLAAMSVMPAARGSGLIGAAIYALAGLSAADKALWA